ncbi:hypothetical protein, partial [Bacillus thuringiensis]|uniref:hypothetical protein n=1 Tax=Bacillus thuringiensis TaxID=1428 RepID=UPI000BFAE5EA
SVLTHKKRFRHKNRLWRRLSPQPEKIRKLTIVSFLILWKGMKPYGFIPFFLLRKVEGTS